MTKKHYNTAARRLALHCVSYALIDAQVLSLIYLQQDILSLDNPLFNPKKFADATYTHIATIRNNPLEYGLSPLTSR